jgi:hypothetical protein
MTHTDTILNLRRSWPVILAIVMAVAAAFCAPAREADNDDDTAAVAVPAEGEATSPVQDYLQFAGTGGDQLHPAADADPRYIVEGLRKLAGALGTLHLGSPDLQVDLRVAAEHVLLNPTSTAITPLVRNDLIAAADAIEAERRTGVKLRSLAESIQRDTPLLDQQGALRDFFRESGKVLQPLSPKN